MTVGVDQQNDLVRAAYDHIAGDYDRQVRGDTWMRRILWQRYLATFDPGEHVLDVSCGTGLDALFLARSGMRVTAIDISPKMIERLHANAREQGMSFNIDARVMDASDLSSLPGHCFAGIVSAFAGLNTLTDLHDFARDASRVLAPNGRMILHLLNRFSLWEWLTLGLHGDWNAAKTLSHASERYFTIGGISVRHRLYTPLDAYGQYFSSSFTLRAAYSVGSLRPPHTLRAVPPHMVRLLGALELTLARRRPLLNLGRFFVLELVKRPADDDGNER